MKKSFILSLVMVVVLIASLATATYAWYTAQTAVQATNVVVATAAAGDSIVIKAAQITSTTETNDTVTLTMETATGARGSIYMPAVLKSASGTAYKTATYSGIEVITATVNKSGAFNSVGTEFAPAKVAITDDASTTSDYMFIANVGSGTFTYDVTVTIDNDADDGDSAANNGLRVAIFKKAGVTEGVSDTDFTLVGVWVPAGEALEYTAAIANGNDPDDFATPIAIGASNKVYQSGNAAEDVGTLVAQCASNDVLAIRVWFDGEKVTNQYQGADAKFKVDITKG